MRYEGFSLLLQKLLSLMNALFFFLISRPPTEMLKFQPELLCCFSLNNSIPNIFFRFFFSFVFIVSSHPWQITAHASLNSFKLLPKKVIIFFKQDDYGV